MSELLDFCFRDRFEDPLNTKIPIFLVAVCLNIVYCIGLFATKNKRSKAIEIIGVWGFYIIGSMIVNGLKTTMNDFTCNTKPNSVSGHTFYNIYFLISSLSLFASDHTRKTLFSTILLIILHLSFFCNIFITYIGGYHSPRQILYGAICGVIFYLLYRITSRLFNTWDFLTATGFMIIMSTFYGLLVGPSMSFLGYSPIFIWYILLCLVSMKKKRKTVN